MGDLPVLNLVVDEKWQWPGCGLSTGIYARTGNDGTWQAMSVGVTAHTPPLIVRGQEEHLFALDTDGELCWMMEARHGKR